MLTLYRRHLAVCPHLTGKKRGTAANEKDSCDCPIWIQGTNAGERIRKSLDTSAWSRAEKEKRKLEDGITPTEQPKSITLKDALAAFIADCETRNLSRNTLRKYRTLESSLTTFAERRGIVRCTDFDADSLRDFRSSRRLAALTSSKELGHLRTFFEFAIQREWLTKNPAKTIKAPQLKIIPRLPFSDKELQAILSKAEDDRELAFLLALRHTGLRIGDCSLLRTTALSDNRIHLHTTKSGSPISVLIPPNLVSLLKALPAKGGYFFLRGESTHRHTAPDLWRKRIKAICKELKITPDHPHRFRHSLACSLLSQGVTVENVAAILGNSPAIVMKHYAQWVRARQDALDAAVQQTWKPSLALVKQS